MLLSINQTVDNLNNCVCLLTHGSIDYTVLVRTTDIVIDIVTSCVDTDLPFWMHMANAAFTCSKSTLFSHYYINLTLVMQFEEHVDSTENVTQ